MALVGPAQLAQSAATTNHRAKLRFFQQGQLQGTVLIVIQKVSDTAGEIWCFDEYHSYAFRAPETLIVYASDGQTATPSFQQEKDRAFFMTARKDSEDPRSVGKPD